jgi:hypothetical protein
MADPQLRQRFSRNEYKYLILPPVAEQLIKLLSRFQMHADQATREGPQQSYHVHSIYFDNPNTYLFYHQKLAGLKNRQKYRLRWYPDAIAKSSQGLFWEIKSRQADHVDKFRTQLSQPQSAKLITNPQTQSAYSPHLNYFLSAINRYRLKPVIGVNYRRRALESDSLPGLRITFDDQLTAQLTDSLDYSQPTQNIISHHLILEIKFRQLLPTWLPQLIASYNLQRLSVSKYCLSMAHCAKLTPLADLLEVN